MTIKEKKQLRLRHEAKHIINAADDAVLTSRLRKLFVHDEHADEKGRYRVNSLYFDTPSDKALRQKIDGVNNREKFRLRYYNDDTSYMRLEKKMKINGLCGKLSARMTREQAELLLQGEIDFLLKSEEPLFVELYSKMKGQLLQPKTIVCYDREAFLYEPGNVRVTVDRNLSTGLRNLDFLNPCVLRSRMQAAREDRVLEVKYDSFLPEIVAMAVQMPNRQASAYSKYAVCRRYD